MRSLPPPLRYFAGLRTPRLVLWCYLVWYLVTVAHEFSPSPRLWMNSLGISGVIGLALLLSVSSSGRDSWQTFRLFLMPFCVSSFSGLIKDRGYFLIFPPDVAQLLLTTGTCAGFVLVVALLKWLSTASATVTAKS